MSTVNQLSHSVRRATASASKSFARSHEQDDADNQQEPPEKSEPQPPQHEPTSPDPQQADDETASAEKTDDETADEIVDEAGNKEADTQAEEGDDSPAGEDQGSGSASTDEAAEAPQEGKDD